MNGYGDPEDANYKLILGQLLKLVDKAWKIETRDRDRDRGRRPPVWLVPHAQNDNFVGRESIERN